MVAMQRASCQGKPLCALLGRCVVFAASTSLLAMLNCSFTALGPWTLPCLSPPRHPFSPSLLCFALCLSLQASACMHTRDECIKPGARRLTFLRAAPPDKRTARGHQGAVPGCKPPPARPSESMRGNICLPYRVADCIVFYGTVEDCIVCISSFPLNAHSLVVCEA